MRTLASNDGTPNQGRQHHQVWGARRHSSPRGCRQTAAPRPSQPGASDILDTERPLQRLFDEAYLIALRDRDQGAEADLVSSFARPIWLKLHARLRVPHLIEDARQETFLRVLTYFRSGKSLQ